MSANRTNSDAASIQTVPVSTDAPHDQNVLVYQASKKAYVPTASPPGTGDIKADGSVPFTGDQSMGGHKLTNLADATNPLDAVNLEVVQANFDIPTGKAGPAAAMGVSARGIRSDATIPIAFGSDALGDLPVRAASAYARLAIGSTGQALIVSGGTAIWGGVAAAGIASGAVTFAKLDASALSVISDPPAASTGDVVIDATASPRADYYMAPAGDQTFDPTAASVSQAIRITKTSTSTHKLTIKVGAGASVAGFTIKQAATINTNFDLPGSATNSATATSQWSLQIDLPNKTIWVSPPA